MSVQSTWNHYFLQGKYRWMSFSPSICPILAYFDNYDVILEATKNKSKARIEWAISYIPNYNYAKVSKWHSFKKNVKTFFGLIS